VQSGQPLAWVHAADEAAAAVATTRVLQAITLGDTAPAASPLLVETIAA